VNVTFARYSPVRSGSDAAITCLNATANVSLLTGASQRVRSGRTTSGRASENGPLESVAGDTLSVASPAVEVTVAVVEPVRSCATPGTNAPSETGAPRLSDSVAGT
jgi:hypothetical protein